MSKIFKIESIARIIFLSCLCCLALGAFQARALADNFSGEIVIGEDNAMTGPYAASTYSHIEAAKDFWAQHKNRISVDGKEYKVKHIFADNKGDVSVTVSNYKRFVGDGAVVVWTNWTPGGLALMPLAKKAHVPTIIGGFSKKMFVPPSKYTYLVQPSYPGALCAGVKWYKENVWKGPGKMKVGLLLWDNGYGRSSDLPEVYDYLKEDLGVEVLPSQFFPYKVKTFTPQLLRLKKQGANLIFIQALAAQYAMLAKDANRLGITPDISLMTTFWCMQPRYLQLAGDAAEGTYGLWHYSVARKDDNSSNPVVQKLRDCMETYRGDRHYDPNYFQGWAYQHLQKHLLEETIKKYGYPITGEQVAETASNLPPWDWGLSRSFSGYSGGDRLGWHEVRVFQIKNNKIECVSDWLPEPTELLKRAPWIVGK